MFKKNKYLYRNKIDMCDFLNYKNAVPKYNRFCDERFYKATFKDFADYELFKAKSDKDARIKAAFISVQLNHGNVVSIYEIYPSSGKIKRFILTKIKEGAYI